MQVPGSVVSGFVVVSCSEVVSSEELSVVAPEVLVAGFVQGVVGLTVTQSQRALTEFRTAIPVSMPHPSMTQF